MDLRLDLMPKSVTDWPQIMRAIEKANPTAPKASWGRITERMGDSREWQTYKFCQVPIVMFEFGCRIPKGSLPLYTDLRK